MKTEKIEINCYYAVINNKKVIDEESIREEFEYKLKELLK